MTYQPQAIERLTSAVVARLEQECEGLTAEHFPDAPDRFAWTKKEKSLLVSFEGGTYASESNSIDPYSMDRALELGVTVITRGLRGKLGMADALELVRKSLFGWEPTENGVVLGWARLLPTAERFVGEDQGVWRFVQLYRTTTTVVGFATERVRAP